MKTNKSNFFLLKLLILISSFSCISCVSCNDAAARKSTIRYNQSKVPHDKLNVGVWDEYYSKIVVKNGTYSSRDEEENTFDLYVPVDDDGKELVKPKPLIVLMHSGAFIKGNKRNYVITQYARDFSRIGFAVASINYNKIDDFESVLLSSVSKVKGRKEIVIATKDAVEAIIHLKENHNEYGIDPDNVYAMGFSAGGIISSHLAFMDDVEDDEYINDGAIWNRSIDKIVLGKNRNSSPLVKGVISLGGGVMNYEFVDDTDILETPILMIHGGNDGIVPLGKERPFAGYKRNLGIHKEASMSFNLGVSAKGRDDGEVIMDVEKNTSLEIKGYVDASISEGAMETFINLFTSPMCGSKCIEERLSKRNQNCQLVVVRDAPHVFMLNEDGSFNQTYKQTRELIYQFIQRNTRNQFANNRRIR